MLIVKLFFLIIAVAFLVQSFEEVQIANQTGARLVTGPQAGCPSGESISGICFTDILESSYTASALTVAVVFVDVIQYYVESIEEPKPATKA